ncbi:hypothetical protein [Fodinicurvata sediminis]|uniref:hypothetical protein n=1 Tax=Fodinicurvata sediminis TaxID=1121832 RepID=UPI0003B693BB|nr:hypothetical protein [Fodinicurvata sediminis]
MTRTTGPPNADLAQRGDHRCAMVTSRSEILRASSAFTRPQRALRSAITIASVVALMGAGTVPATAQDGDTAEGSLAEELASDAASEYARDAKEGLDERQESDTRQQNRADQESREDGSIQERQEERAREEIKDAVTKAYLSGEDGSETARDAVNDDSSSDNDEDKKNQDNDSAEGEGEAAFDVAIPGVKPNWDSDADIEETGIPGAIGSTELGWGPYPGVEPDIYGAEVVGRLANQVIPSGPMGEAGNPTGELGKYLAVPGVGKQSGRRIGAGYGGIFGGLSGVKAPSGAESGRMQGDETIVITDGEGNIVNKFKASELDTITGDEYDWGFNENTGEIEITATDNSGDQGTGGDVMEFGEDEAVSGSESGQEGGSDEDEETMVFGEEEAEEAQSGDEDSNENDSESGQESSNEDNSDSDQEDNNESDSESESNSTSSSDSSDDSEEKDKADKDEGDTLPAPGQRGGPPLTEGEKELVNRFDDTDEDIKRAANNSNTTMPAQPEGGKIDLDLPWNILNQLDKTTMPVRPGSMQQSAMPLPLSVWNPGYIDPHRGN